MNGDASSRYRRIRHLDGGGLGVVHLAFDEELERHVVLKHIRPELLESEAACERFRSECRALSRLSHPHVVRLLAVLDADPPCVVLEYVDGESLAEILDRHRQEGTKPSIDDCLAWAEQTARALQHVHENGLVHRDVKPHNIVVTRTGQAVLIDFGFVRDERSTDVVLTRTGQTLGSPPYMAPERVLDDGLPIDGQADVFALGVVLFEALSLSSPFLRPTPHETHESVCKELPPRLRRLRPEVSRDLELVVETAMAKQRGHRYPAALALAEDLAACRRGDRPSGVQRSLWSRGLAAGRRHLVVTSAVVLTLATTVTVWSTISFARETATQQSISATDKNLWRVIGRGKELCDDANLFAALPGAVAGAEQWLQEADELLALRSWLATSSDLSVLSGAGNWPAWVAAAQLRLESLLAAREVVRRRSELGRTLAKRSLRDHAEAWAVTSSAVARAKVYGGLMLRPQLGLVPLGKDPQSGLEEFAHIGTGVVPVRDPGSGRLVITPETSLVFVLLPGGESHFGAQSVDATGINYDPAAQTWEGPPRPIRHEAFFLSKYEMTRAQWRRLSDAPDQSPSTLVERNHDPAMVPVANVSWLECKQLLDLYALELPTETQWECACRAGTSTMWWTGDDIEAFRRSHQLRGEATEVHRGTANGWGLVHMHDGVREWCSNVYDEARSGAARSVRPGLWNYGSTTVNGTILSPHENGCRSAARDKQPEVSYQFDLGLRPMRRIQS
ncbi:MAG TPA: bifunctional serine/threonine-protein kinase/formylglycine-generating enzyme family protein [Planctomycetota bacterium]